MRTLLLLSLVVTAVGCAAPAPRDATTQPASTLAAPAGLTDAEFGAWLRGERDRVARERSAARERYDSDERACWQRFAVNDCLREARVRRRDVLDALRRDELALNAIEREHKTSARLRALGQKSR